MGKRLADMTPEQREKARARNREAARRWRAANPDRTKPNAYNRAYRERNPGVDRAYREANASAIRAQRAAYRAAKQDEIREKKRAYRAANRAAINARQRDRKYGLGDGDYERLWEAQGGKCAVCGDALPPVPHVDHDHETAAVRGLLHSGCNLGIGHFSDDPRKLRAAAAYLENPPAAGVLPNVAAEQLSIEDVLS